MKLGFRLLLVDDNPDAIEQALKALEDHLKARGFTLHCQVAEDRSLRALRRLARQNGRDLDLVVIDYNLGNDDGGGAEVVEELRRELQYTDIIFYSSDPAVNLWEELAKKEVMGVFIVNRVNIGEYLNGIADTIIGKAVDLNHMRGIAMAEVAEMDVLMEETLHKVFESELPDFRKAATDTLRSLLEGTEARLEKLRPYVEKDDIKSLVGNSLMFSSADKYKAIRRSARKLTSCPPAALEFLKGYEEDIIRNRNILAHAKEENGPDGEIGLRSVKRGEEPILIDEEWMIRFRGKLRDYRNALDVVCNALTNSASVTIN